jgi:16S rRNA (adenine1518-N6/adenine1519-N6)-dimethyltransferase
MKHLRPRRGLGQSFLTYEPVADQLVAGLELRPEDTVLEIGPGKGILTRRLLEQAGRVIAVDIDERLIDGLRLELGATPHLTLIHADFLGFGLSDFRHLKVIGNLPYCLSSQMLFHLLDQLESWDTAVLTTQREFAQRLLALPGTRAYGAITVFFDRLMHREKLFSIEPWCFKPRPDVVSTSFRLARRESPLYEVYDGDTFRRVVKACFVQRRKTLANNLVAGLGISRISVWDILNRAEVSGAVRAETLTGLEFQRLARAWAAVQAASSSR